MEKEEDILKLEFYIDVIFNDYRFFNQTIFSRIKNFINIIWKRIIISLRVLFKGRVELTQEFILDNKEQINDFIKALEEGKEYLKNQ
jgi:hypothetical protein